MAHLTRHRTNNHFLKLRQIIALVAGLICLCSVSLHQCAAVEPDDSLIVIYALAVDDPVKAALQLQEKFRADLTSNGKANQRELLFNLIDLEINLNRWESVSPYIDRMKSLDESQGDVDAKALGAAFQALVFAQQGKIEETRKDISLSLTLTKTAHDGLTPVRVQTVASKVEQQLSNYRDALQHQLAALQLSEKTISNSNTNPDLQRINSAYRVRMLNRIATLFQILNDPKSALTYSEQAIQIAEDIHFTNLLPRLISARGNYYMDLGQMDNAVMSYQRAYDIARQAKDELNQAIALDNLSDAMYRTGDYSKCLKVGKQTFELANKIARDDVLSDIEITLGLCRLSSGDRQEGVQQIEVGLALSRTARSKPELASILNKLATAYQKQGMYKEASQMSDESRRLSTEVFQADRERMLNDMQLKYEMLQRDRQIDSLEHQNHVQEIELHNKQLQRYLMALVIILLLLITVIIMYFYRRVRVTNQSLREANEKLEILSSRDPLTGLFNRRTFEDLMRTRAESALRRRKDKHATPYALALIDIDFFKLVNDKFGHAVGDLVLKEISQRVSRMMREDDRLMRWGGEEFLLFLDNIEVENLDAVVGRVLALMADAPVLVSNKAINVTISMGYVLVRPDEVDVESLPWEILLKLADASLYKAKSDGRNRAVGIIEYELDKEAINTITSSDLNPFIAQGKIKVHEVSGVSVDKTH